MIVKTKSPVFHFRNKHDKNIKNVARIHTASQLKLAGIRNCIRRVQNIIPDPIPRHYIQSPLSKLQLPISFSITVCIGGES
jgi:hypothetical protein